MARAHFKCVGGKGIIAVKHPEYESREWDISEDDARKLVGGQVYFHETKAQPSYFGGRVTSYKVEKTAHAHEHRVIFVLRSEPDAKGVSWTGRSDVNAHYSGLVD